MEEGGNTKRKTPNIPIDEAIKLYLSMIYPNGVPDGLEEEKLFQKLREKIAKDRPNWDQKFPKILSEESKELVCEKTYSQIKQEIMQKSRESEIPSDPDEYYFYQRDQEAIYNRKMKKEEKKEEKKTKELIRKLIDSKKGKIKEAVLEKILKFREIIKSKLENRLHIPKISSAITEKEIISKLQQPQVEFNSSLTHHPFILPFLPYLNQEEKEKIKIIFDQTNEINTIIKKDLKEKIPPKYLMDSYFNKRPAQNTKYFDVEYHRPIKNSSRSSLNIEQKLEQKDRLDINFDLKLDKMEKSL